MSQGILEDNKSYSLIRKNGKSSEVVLSGISKKSAEVGYWDMNKIQSATKVPGTEFELRAVIPRMAGSDYFVDHGGEIETRTIIVPKGTFVKVHGALRINPETGEYRISEGFELK